MTNQALIKEISAIIDTASEMKNSYFWSPPANASGRRSYERKMSHDKIAWIDGGITYTAQYNVSCSCKNIYASGIYTRDGKKTTLTAIKNSLKRLEAAEAISEKEAV